jgi:hypothetical protein
MARRLWTTICEECRWLQSSLYVLEAFSLNKAWLWLSLRHQGLKETLKITVGIGVRGRFERLPECQMWYTLDPSNIAIKNKVSQMYEIIFDKFNIVGLLLVEKMQRNGSLSCIGPLYLQFLLATPCKKHLKCASLVPRMYCFSFYVPTQTFYNTNYSLVC